MSGKLAGVVHRSIVLPLGGVWTVIHSTEYEWGSSGLTGQARGAGCRRGDYPKMAAMVVRIPAVFGKWTKGAALRRGALLGYL
jgi:hypothetical protein